MSVPREQQRALLQRVARRAMKERGLEADFPAAALAEARALAGPAAAGAAEAVRDLTGLLWCSIDNDDSRDLDQLTVAAPAGAATTIYVAVADVSAVVGPGSALDEHAQTNTTSVYTAAQIFPMLPERLSTDLSSLNADQDRLALVVEAAVDGTGSAGASSVYRARVRSQAKLAYSSVGAWLEGRAPAPAALERVPGLADNLRLQDAAAQRLKAWRHLHGALELETLEARAVFDGDTVSGLAVERRNRAREIIEDYMIAANGVIARFLAGRGFPVMRRVLRTPERWPRIVELAATSGDRLPPAPDAAALHEFLVRRRAADPDRFPDLSLSVIKLLGRGEYDATMPGQESAGHFGLAVSDYTHSTAPNRRYPDLITQRLLRAALAGGAQPYAPDQLRALATHCTQMQDAAQSLRKDGRLLAGMWAPLAGAGRAPVERTTP